MHFLSIRQLFEHAKTKSFILYQELTTFFHRRYKFIHRRKLKEQCNKKFVIFIISFRLLYVSLVAK